MEKRKSLVFYLEWMKVLRKYDRIFRWVVVEAICDYQETGKVPDFRSYFKKEELKSLPDSFISNAETAFAFIKEDIDRNNAKYEALCEKRREWAKKGGIAKAKKYSKSNNVPSGALRQEMEASVPSLPDNENENDNDILNNENNINNNKLINKLIDKSKKENFKNLENFDSDDKEDKEPGNFQIEFGAEQYSLPPEEFLILINSWPEVKAVKKEVGPAVFDSLFSEVMKDWEKDSKGAHRNINETVEHLLNHIRIKNNYRLKKERYANKPKQSNRRKSNSDKQGEAPVAGKPSPVASDYE